MIARKVRKLRIWRCRQHKEAYKNGMGFKLNRHSITEKMRDLGNGINFRVVPANKNKVYIGSKIEVYIR